MHQHEEDHETEYRRVQFGLGHVHENHRLRQRFAAWMVIFIIGVACVILGTVTVWLP